MMYQCIPCVAHTKTKTNCIKTPTCAILFEKQGVQGYQGYNIPTRSTFCLSTRPDHVMIITAEFNRFHFYLTNLSSILYSCSYMLLHPSTPPLAISALTAANGIFLSFQFTKEPWKLAKHQKYSKKVFRKSWKHFQLIPNHSDSSDSGSVEQGFAFVKANRHTHWGKANRQT